MDITKDELKEIIKEVVVKCLTINVKYEQHRDIDTGLPLAVPKIKEEDVYLPCWLIDHQPYLEGALRGNQQTIDKLAGQLFKTQNELEQMKIGMDAMANVLIGLEGSIKSIAYTPIKQININRDSKLFKLEAQINEGGSEQEKETARDKWKSITGEEYESSN